MSIVIKDFTSKAQTTVFKTKTKDFPMKQGPGLRYQSSSSSCSQNGPSALIYDPDYSQHR